MSMTTFIENTINVNVMTFAGLKLDVITGHPDHELLFKATQVAGAAGIKYPSASVNKIVDFKGFNGVALRVSDLGETSHKMLGHRVSPKMWLFNEAAVYSMLLRGHTTAGEPFRKWVTEEVLPTIRKTGSYNVETSETPEGIQFAAEFSAMRLMLNDLRDEVAGLKETILKWKIPAPMQVIAKSPYEGQAKSNVFHAMSAKQYNECAEGLNVSRLVSELGVTPSHLEACRRCL
ncbi:putative phage-related protein [Pectobacterium atrosepticum SCRI1043]|uniref:Phage-related protein n=1 Tax=Pectobacterium atrosepticum (strain SCRI 1043 / ATCC BAA-672) TaxID=218491 RepID=Q6D4T2_PECAS|nr:BRO family protein [Pectobacterium atrosepticum]MCL6315699.1 hypothetical protein [Pectobacterium atrosepticum]MCL6320065.1 hypothetical protein [Pectobacterium atrosepticum]CAG75211.1 putative phage-related protein [Pectobacterium atrosepticum SCRI1043]